METRIGKIQSARFGMGGYQDAQFGLSLSFGSDKDKWGVNDFKGFWAYPPSQGAQWTRDDQTGWFGDLCRQVIGYLDDAKVSDVSELVGKPVELTFDGNMLQSWRILTEAI